MMDLGKGSYGKARISLAEVLAGDYVVPVKHERTSCSDDDLRNAGPNSEHFARCLRCVFMKGLMDPEWAAKVVIEVTMVASAEVPCSAHDHVPRP